MLKRIVSILIMLLSVGLSVYVGAYLFFIKPIIDACTLFDVGLLTGSIVAVTVIKCVFAGTIGTLVLSVGILLTKIINLT